MRLFSVGGYGLALVVFGAYMTATPTRTRVFSMAKKYSRGMAEGYLHDEFRREIKVIRVVAIGGQKQGQNIEAGAFALPAEPETHLEHQPRLKRLPWGEFENTNPKGILSSSLMRALCV